MLEVDWTRVKGKAKLVKVYALLGDSKLQENPQFQKLAARHEQMLEAYRTQKWDQALRLIDLLLKDELSHGMKNLYLLYQESAVFFKERPFDEKWDSVGSLKRHGVSGY